MLWDQLLYAFIKKGRRQAFQPFLHNVFCPLVTPQILGWPKISWCLETSDSHFVQGQDCVEDARKFPT
jgi:hypothetical protein